MPFIICSPERGVPAEYRGRARQFTERCDAPYANDNALITKIFQSARKRTFKSRQLERILDSLIDARSPTPYHLLDRRIEIKRRRTGLIKQFSINDILMIPDRQMLSEWVTKGSLDLADFQAGCLTAYNSEPILHVVRRLLELSGDQLAVQQQAQLVIGLHAIARRLQRGWPNDDASLRSDLLALVSAQSLQQMFNYANDTMSAAIKCTCASGGNWYGSILIGAETGDPTIRVKTYY